MGGDVCVVHVSRVCRGGGAGHAKNLAPAGMFNGHLAHVAVVVLVPLVRGAPRVVQRYHGEVRL